MNLCGSVFMGRLWEVICLVSRSPFAKFLSDCPHTSWPDLSRPSTCLLEVQRIWLSEMLSTSPCIANSTTTEAFQNSSFRRTRFSYSHARPSFFISRIILSFRSLSAFGFAAQYSVFSRTAPSSCVMFPHIWHCQASVPGGDTYAELKRMFPSILLTRT